MSRALKTRFSAMMFLEYAVPAATIPILSHYLKNHLGFEPDEVGRIMAMLPLAAIVAPFLTAHLADRWISAERLLAVCHFACSAVMLALASQTRFASFLGLYFVYGLLFTPTFGLTNTVVLHHVRDAKRDFGGVRMWGTVGWVAVAWIFGLCWLRPGGPERLRHALVLSSLLSVTLGAYALTLPRGQVPRARTHVSLLASYWRSLRVFARPSLALLCALTFINAIVHQMYYFGMGPHLSQAGFSDGLIMPVMSVGQVSEVIMLGLLGLCLARFGTKTILVIGAVSQVSRYILFAIGYPEACLIAGILLHGFCYAFWFTAAYLYVDHHSTPESRAGAQQLFTVVISGLGPFVAFRLAGYVGQRFLVPGTALIDFHRFWLVPAALSIVITVLMLLFFKEEPPEARDAQHA